MRPTHDLRELRPAKGRRGYVRDLYRGQGPGTTRILVRLQFRQPGTQGARVAGGFEAAIVDAHEGSRRIVGRIREL